MLGDSLLVSPVLHPNQTVVSSAYIPPGNWYDFYRQTVSYEVLNPEGIHQDLNASLHEMPIHIRGGSIIPMTQPKMTTFESRNSDYQILVAFDLDGKAKGSLYLDDGESLNVEDEYTYVIYEAYNWNVLIANVKWGKYDDGVVLNKIVILGVKCPDSDQVKIKNLKFNDSVINLNENIVWEFDEKKRKLTLEGLNTKLNARWNMSWEIC